MTEACHLPDLLRGKRRADSVALRSLNEYYFDFLAVLCNFFRNRGIVNAAVTQFCFIVSDTEIGKGACTVVRFVTDNIGKRIVWATGY